LIEKALQNVLSPSMEPVPRIAKVESYQNLHKTGSTTWCGLNSMVVPHVGKIRESWRDSGRKTGHGLCSIGSHMYVSQTASIYYYHHLVELNLSTF
jgi:hypothetical protein